tara:strand:+ start:1419 stop:1631 length:213 start_codon:yes stop_codon:yes gene_type:complete
MTSRFNFAKGLKVSMSKNGVSPSELAERMNVSRQSVSNWRSRPDGKLSQIKELSEAIGCDPVQFVEDSIE